ncbi:hypothetical protein [Methylobacterium sp. sgz302541]|uniref:hypothetical protein n=1 Tax=unclassified Methylobacterium TaxID=2615210 RepID=UPI003D357A57
MAGSSGKLNAFDIPVYSASDPTTVVQVLPAATARSRWRILNTGGSLLHYGFDPSTLRPGYGWPMEVPATPNGQGGGDDSDQAALGPVYVVASSAGGRVVVQDFA